MTQLLTRGGSGLLEEEATTFRWPERAVLRPTASGFKGSSSAAPVRVMPRPASDRKGGSIRPYVTGVARAIGAAICAMFFLDCLADEEWPERIK
jgi:hypothetical protein